MNRQEMERILTIAIGREIAANRFYADAAARLKSPTASEIFRKLARDEEGHRDALERLRRDPSLQIKFTAPKSDFKVSESETGPELTVDLAPRDAVALAMKKEQEAVEFYRALGVLTDDEGSRRLFENLGAMELSHKQALEKVFVDIGYPEVF